MFLEKENNNIYLHNQFIWRQKINVFVYSAPIFWEIVKKNVNNYFFWVEDWRKGREEKNKIICFVDKLVWYYIN